jgi:hypothetical protein
MQDTVTNEYFAIRILDVRFDTRTISLPSFAFCKFSRYRASILLQREWHPRCKMSRVARKKISTTPAWTALYRLLSQPKTFGRE